MVKNIQDLPILEHDMMLINHQFMQFEDYRRDNLGPQSESREFIELSSQLSNHMNPTMETDFDCESDPDASLGVCVQDNAGSVQDDAGSAVAENEQNGIVDNQLPGDDFSDLSRVKEENARLLLALELSETKRLDFAENESNRIAELVRIGIEQAMILDRLQKDEKAAQDIKAAEKKAAEKISEDIKAAEKKAAEKISEDTKAAEKKAAERISEQIKAAEQLIAREVQTFVDTSNAAETTQKIYSGKRQRTASPANEFSGSTRSYETYKHMVRLPSESSYPKQTIPKVFRENSNHTVLYNSATCIVFFFLSRLTV